MRQVETGQRPSLEHLSKPFIPARDISRKDRTRMETRATHALFHHLQLGTGIRLGIGLAVFSKESALRKVDRLKRRNPPIDVKVEIETLIHRQRSDPHFMNRDKDEYLRILLVNKTLFDQAPIPFDRELFDAVNRSLGYVNNRGEAQFWRVHMEEARALALLYPQHRVELAVDEGFYSMIARKLRDAQEMGDGEDTAAIAASARIIYPDRFPRLFQAYPETWIAMKQTHHQLSELVSQADPKTGFPYEYHLRLAQHDANMAIISARSITVTSHTVSIALAM